MIRVTSVEVCVEYLYNMYLQSSIIWPDPSHTGYLIFIKVGCTYFKQKAVGETWVILLGS